MAIKPIRPLYSPSATATNGSDTITVTGDVDCSYIYDGFLVALGTRQVVEAVRGTSPDGSGNSTITLRRNWDAANTTAPLLGWNSIEGLPAAINQLRQIIGDSQDINDQLLPLANLMGAGIIRKTGTETYELLSDTSAGRAILQASDATAQRVELGLGTAATRNTGTNPDQIPLNSDLGTAATRNTGTNPDQIPLNSDLGTAATRDVTTSPTDTVATRILSVGAGHQQLDSSLYRTGNILGTVSQSGGIPTGAIIQRGSNVNGEFVRFADGTQICTRLIGIGDFDWTINNSPQDFSYPAAFSGAIPSSSVSFTPSNEPTQWDRYDAVTFMTSAAVWRVVVRGTQTASLQGMSFLAIGRWY